MKLAHVAVGGIRGLPDLSFSLQAGGTSEPYDNFVLFGPSGSGKTRLLEAIIAAKETVGPYVGMVRPSDWMRDEKKGAHVELSFSLNEEERLAAPNAGSPARVLARWTSQGLGSEADRGLVRLLERYEHVPNSGKFEYLPENRQRAWGARSDGLGALEQSLLRLSKDPQKFSFLPRFLTSLRGDAAKTRAFADAVGALSATIRVKEPEDQDDDTYFKNRFGEPVFFSQLSASETDAVLIAATAINIALHHSIVFLDRPELYVHPKRLGLWLAGLAKLGRNNQWLIATASPLVSTSVTKAQLLTLELQQ
jgi:RecA/RadA recombinase